MEPDGFDFDAGVQKAQEVPRGSVPALFGRIRSGKIPDRGIEDGSVVVARYSATGFSAVGVALADWSSGYGPDSPHVD